MLYFRMTMTADGESVKLQVPYAIVEYQTTSSEMNEEVSVAFNIEYSINMDHAVVSIKVQYYL